MTWRSSALSTAQSVSADVAGMTARAARLCWVGLLWLVVAMPGYGQSFDWRDVDGQNYMTPVKNQGSSYSCWAFAAVGALEARCNIVYQNPDLDLDLSEQHLVCGTSSLGASITQVFNYIQRIGVVTEAELPYTDPNPSPNWPLQSWWEERVLKITGYAPVICTTDQIKQSLRTYGPLLAAIDSSTDFFWPSGGLQITATGGTPADHDVVIAGYRDDPAVAGGGYWIVKNSWGPGWGDGGYGYIQYGNVEAHNEVSAITGLPYYGWERNVLWQGGAGEWAASGNWNRGVPSADKEVYINGGPAELSVGSWETATINIGCYDTGELSITGGSLSCSTAYVGHYNGDSGSVTVSGASSTWSTGALSLGSLGTGSLNINPGGLVASGGGYLGWGEGSQGTARVDGAGSTWTVDGTLNVGGSGTGTVQVTHGGSLSSVGVGSMIANGPGTGSVTVDGIGSTWTCSGYIWVGSSGSGSLAISHGGAVSNTEGRVGYAENSQGAVLVAGPDSKWMNSSSVRIGYNGVGSLEISDDGLVSSNSGRVGENQLGTGAVTVNGTGAKWINSTSLEIGRRGHGTLEIIDGGCVSNMNGYIGDLTGFTGSGTYGIGVVTVSGPGSTWTNSGSLYIGGNESKPGGTGELIVADSGTVTVGNTLRLWEGSSVTLSGGTVTVGGGPVETTADTLRVALDGTLAGLGSVVGNVVNSGRVCPGKSVGLLNITGDYTQEEFGTLQIELGPESIDLLEISGTAALDGQLEVILLDGFLPSMHWTSDYFLTARALSMGSHPDYFLSIANDWAVGADGNALFLKRVPEPTTPCLLATGVLALARRRRIK